MNQVFQVSPKELIYLSSLTDHFDLWGLSNPYENMDKAEIERDKLLVEQLLRQKGFLTLEGERDEDLAEMIRCCERSPKVLIFRTDAVTPEKRIHYFNSADGIIRGEIGEEICLQRISLESMREELVDFFIEGNYHNDTEKITVHSGRMDILRALSRERYVQELRNWGCKERLAEAIADSMQTSAACRALICYKVDNARYFSNIEFVLTLHFPNGDIMSVSDGETQMYMMEFGWLNWQWLSDELRKISEEYFLQEA